MISIAPFTLGIIHDDLKTFLEANIPTGKKKSKVLLGVADPKLGAAIQETVDIQCESGGWVVEVLRGVRFHFEKMIKGLTGPMAAKAQLGLGHSYSRAKVKFNVHRVDNMIIQSISLLDQLDKDINTFSMRIRYDQDVFKFAAESHIGWLVTCSSLEVKLSGLLYGLRLLSFCCVIGWYIS